MLFELNEVLVALEQLLVHVPSHQRQRLDCLHPFPPESDEHSWGQDIVEESGASWSQTKKRATNWPQCAGIMDFSGIGVSRPHGAVDFFNLDVIISVDYRVKSHRGTQFRIWATQRLREYVIRGFTLDDERLKRGGGGNYFDELLERIRDICSSEKVFWKKVLEIYATSIDYDPRIEASRTFFATEARDHARWPAESGHAVRKRPPGKAVRRGYSFGSRDSRSLHRPPSRQSCGRLSPSLR